MSDPVEGLNYFHKLVQVFCLSFNLHPEIKVNYSLPQPLPFTTDPDNAFSIELHYDSLPDAKIT